MTGRWYDAVGGLALEVQRDGGSWQFAGCIREKSSSFEIHIGGSAPHHTEIREDDLNGDETDETLSDMFQEEIERHFRETCHPYSSDEAAFIEWAKALREKSE